MPDGRQYALDGVRVYPIKRHTDERGLFGEVLRQDWGEFLGQDKVVQVDLSLSYPGIVRAWHRHTRGQTDYFLVIQGKVKIAAYDDRDGLLARDRLVEITVSGDELQLARVPGHYWHGTKSIGDKPSLTLYFVTRLYDYADPDEERQPANSTHIIDPRTNRPYDWGVEA